MGKTFRSFEKSERYDYHDPVDETNRKKAKRGQIRNDLSQHQDRRTDQFRKLDAKEED